MSPGSRIGLHRAAKSGIVLVERHSIAVLCWVGWMMLLVGCSTPLKRLDATAIEGIKLGTPKSELDPLLGRPQEIQSGGDGKTVAYYMRMRIRGGIVDHERYQLRTLSLRYNRNMHLEKKLLYEGEVKKDTSIFGPDRIGSPLMRQEIVEKLRVGQTRKEVVEIFKPPYCELLNVAGGSTMLWYSAKQRMSFSLFQRFETLQLSVNLDDLGVVTSYHVTGSFDPTEKDLQRAPK